MSQMVEVKTETKETTPSISTGLSDLQIKERVEKGQVNVTNKKYSKSYLSIISNNVLTFFNFLGLASFIALIATGASPNQFIFVFFYIANITIGIVQEIRAKRCVDRLSLVANKKIKAIRNGVETEIMSEQLVIDDVFILGMGSQIPTDSVILSGEVEVNESLLTGESVAVKKVVGDNLLAGSFITSGVCTVQAVKVGKDNYVEMLSDKAKAYKKPNSEIMRSLKHIIKFVGITILPIAIALAIKSLIINPDKVAEAILGSATVVIGMIPAGMILLTSLALAVGIVKLAKHNTLVQDLYSLEMLARVDTICFDKTGTITDGNMNVSEVVDLQNSKTAINDVVSSMVYALNDSNQTAVALKEYFGSENHYNSKYVLPFSSARKLSAVTFDNGETFAFGAPEFILSENDYSLIKDKIDSYAKKGLRVLLLANSKSEIENDTIPSDFTPVALIIIADHIREDAIDTVNWFKQNGVSIKVISGDNPLTVSEVSKRAGIDNADKYISLDGLSEEEVLKVANDYTVFGRVSPEQKAILIKALKNAGHVVAMTGDGVNDILAMKEADCAISVASGSEAARNVSHLVLLDSNFNSMPKIVYEGRRVINNVQNSASLFLMKTLFTMIMAIITLIIPYMHTYPFVASQMNPLEFLVIGVPAFFLSLRPNDARVEGRFISHVIKKSLPCALLMLFGVAVIEVIKNVDGTNIELYTNMQVYTILLAGVINLFYACKPLNLFNGSVFFIAGICVVGIIAVSIFNIVPMFNSFFMYQAMLPIKDNAVKILTVFAIALFDIPLSIVLQKWFKKMNFDRLFSKK